MVKRKQFVAFLMIGIGLLSAHAGQNRFEWEELAELPAAPGMAYQQGLAGLFAGAHNGAILVAGGANFPGKPVQEGGGKRYYDNVFVLESTSGEWRNTLKLPQGAVAYGVSVNTPKGVVCVGGSNGETNLSSVVLMSWDAAEKATVFRSLPDFPATLKSAAGTADGDKVYVACGVQNGEASNRFFMLDLSKEGSADFQWVELPPLPGARREQAVMVHQGGGANGSIYLVSGFGKVKGITKAFTDGYVYDPGKKEWSALAPVPVSLLGATGIKSGTHHILFFGGFNKEVFENAVLESSRLKGAELAAFKTAYFSQKPEAFKWNKKIIAYHTVTGTWAEIDDYPYPPNCGAGIVGVDEGGIMIVNGEIMPGTRTPKVYLGRLRHEARFGAINWMVLVVYLFGMLGIGFYFMKRERGTEDFFKGGGRIPWWAVGVSIVAKMLTP
ncbi:MAG: cyclically-permuted mutarotase family protein, partial [Verrucomicrobiota bacterium]|nr:cyclically-permuted mutarotase family protein [Verrucomicrobiota bacterium]